MKTNNAKLFVVLAFMLVLFLSPVQASLIVNKVTDEFSLESPYPIDNIKACQCSVRTDVLEIENIGDFDTLFKVEIFSPTEDLITLSDDTFELAPCEKNTVYVYIKVPCDQPLETFYVAKVSTNYGRSKEIYKEIISKKCQNIKMTCEVASQDKQVKPGEIITVKVDLQNVADFTDTFTITPKYYDDFTVMSEEEVTLAPDEEETIYMYVTFPLTHYGNINYPVRVSSEKGQNIEECVQNLNIERDYDFTIKTEDLEVSACEDITKKIPVTFVNLAGTPNKYYLYLTGPEFAELSQTELDLAPGEADAITLNVNPTQEDVGEYDLILSAGTEYGDINKDKHFKLKVKDCFDSSASFADFEAGVQEKVCCGKKTYTLNIRNDGLYEEAYEIIVDSQGWVSLSEEDRFVRLRPSQNKDVSIDVDFPCTDDKQTAFVLVKQLRAPYQTHELRLELESLSQRSCYNVDLLQDKFRINYETNSIPMLLQNTGLRGGTYRLELGELESRFVYLKENTMDFEAGEVKVLHVYPKDYADYKQGTYLNKLELGISLLDEDCKANCYTGDAVDMKYNKQFWIILKDKNFVVKAIDYIRNFNYSRIGWCGLITLILAALCVVMLIVVCCMRFKKDLKVKRIKASCINKIKIFNVILILLLILSILAIILIGNPNTDKFYENPSEADSPLFHEWKQNTPYTINLEQYFEDPDKDILSYTASQPDHVHISIEDNVALLRPEHNWAGEEFIVFTANDEKGGVTDSPIMTLKVLEKKPVGVLGLWNAYCKHINLVLFIVLILLVLLFFDVLEDKGYNHYKSGKNGEKKVVKVQVQKTSKLLPITREKGWLYYVDRDGNVSRSKMARGGKKIKTAPQLVAKTRITRKEGYLYYIDKKGYIATAKMARRGKASGTSSVTKKVVKKAEKKTPKPEKLRITREKGYLYYVDKKGDVSRARMARKGKKTSSKPQLVAKAGIEKKAGYLYYIDKQGYIAKSKMVHGGQKKPTAKKKTTKK